MPRDPDLRRRLELAVFLSVIVPAIVLSWLTDFATGTFSVNAVAVLAHDLALTGLVAFFVWSGDEPLSAIGWTWHRAGREVAIGALLYIPLLAAIAIVSLVLHAFGVAPSPSLPTGLSPHSSGEQMLAIVLVLVVAISEETVFRGYLLLRLRQVTGSTAAAVVIATAIFASGHAYEGAAGIVAVTILGVVFSLVVVWRRSLIAAIVMHFLQDLLGLVILPLLS